MKSIKVFPLNKKLITINQSNTDFLSSYKDQTEVPEKNHPGSFGYIRKNHIHEGIDLYAEDGDEVYAMESGIVTIIIPFTGKIAGSNWWNDTYSILIESESGAINYGELIPTENIKKGTKVTAGQIIGHVRTVLKINKGRPMSMLHLELYESGTLLPIKEWPLNTEKPKELKDPTPLIKNILNNK